MITYSWNIIQLDCYPEYNGETDVVFNVWWSYNGIDGLFASGIPGETEIKLNTSESFTPYNQLTQDEVVSWIINVIGQPAVTEMENQISSQIQQEKTPTFISPPLPWL